MRPELKAKISRQIKNKEIFCFSGRRVRILEITGDGRVKVLNQKANKNAFRVFTIDYDRLEEIIENPYSHKDPISFLRRNGFIPICSDDGRPLMEKTVRGYKVIIGHDNPATKKSKFISLGIESKNGGVFWTLCSTNNFKEVLSRIPESVDREIQSSKKK